MEKYILYAIRSKFVSGFLLYFIFIPGVYFNEAYQSAFDAHALCGLES